MNATDPQTRLQRLDGYLRDDPGNLRLLHDAFETARQARDWPRAAAYAQQAVQQGPDVMWRLRAGEVALAQLHWEEAASLLDSVRLDPTASAEVQLAAEHQLAEVMLHTHRPDVGIALLANRLEGPTHGASAAPATQVLWLRLLHRVGRLQAAVETAERWEAAGVLTPGAAGVVSLVALDLDRVELAERWAQRSLQAGHRQFEALITGASTALGHADAVTAQALLGEALQLHPRDGRSWAMLGFACLLSQQLEQAVKHFEAALRYMPEHVGTWHGLGWALILQQDFARARETFEHTLEMDRNFAESHGGLAVALALAGEREAAATAAETARRLDSTSLAARYAQAVLAGEHRDVARLGQLAARALAGRGAMADEAARRLGR